jgi:Fur family transcriptional regulator, ferric uptake regulator
MTKKENELKQRFAKDISEEMDVFSNFLKKKNLKVTSQRLLVAEKIFSLHNHFTADGLLEMFRDRRNEISKATIYRILSIMVEANLLIEHNFGQDYKYYEHIIGHEHHDHIICTDCRRIVEFLEPSIEELQSKVALEHGFTIKGHRHNIFGICQKKPNCEYYKK